MHTKIGRIAALCLTAMGCAYASPIQPAANSDSAFWFPGWGDPVHVVSEPPDGEQFRVSHRASTGFTPVSALRRTAEGRAKEFCARDGNVATAVTEQLSSPPHILGNFPRYELVFVCTKPESVAPAMDPYDRLERLKGLLDSGAITQEEFDREKAAILSH